MVGVDRLSRSPPRGGGSGERVSRTGTPPPCWGLCKEGYCAWGGGRLLKPSFLGPGSSLPSSLNVMFQSFAMLIFE